MKSKVTSNLESKTINQTILKPLVGLATALREALVASEGTTR